MLFKRSRTIGCVVAAGCILACAKGGEGSLNLPPETFGNVDDAGGSSGSGSSGGSPSGNGGSDDATVGGGGGGNNGSCGACTTDSDCQSCGAPASGGIYCCDVATGMCVQMTASSCPAQDDSGGGASSSGMMPI
jgi:hypothetical protein